MKNRISEASIYQARFQDSQEQVSTMESWLLIVEVSILSLVHGFGVKIASDLLGIQRQYLNRLTLRQQIIILQQNTILASWQSHLFSLLP